MHVAHQIEYLLFFGVILLVFGLRNIRNKQSSAIGSLCSFYCLIVALACFLYVFCNLLFQILIPQWQESLTAIVFFMLVMVHRVKTILQRGYLRFVFNSNFVMRYTVLLSGLMLYAWNYLCLQQEEMYFYIDSAIAGLIYSFILILLGLCMDELWSNGIRLSLIGKFIPWNQIKSYSFKSNGDFTVSITTTISWLPFFQLRISSQQQHAIINFLQSEKNQ